MTPPPSIERIEAELVEEFEFLDTWTDRYAYLIDLAKRLPPLDDADRNEANRVHGCQSQVWLKTTLHDDRVHFDADSDALITKGLVALLVRVLSDQPAQAIAHADLRFLDRIGMRRHLSPNRSNGLNAMVRRMKAEAAARLQGA